MYQIKDLGIFLYADHFFNNRNVYHVMQKQS